MSNESLRAEIDRSRHRPGVVLLVTVVMLVVLSVLGYTLTSRLTAQRHRQRYLIDYSAARYGCDSAVKYAIATLEEISPTLVSRPNEPDFSDLFMLSEEEYQELLDQWAAEKALQTDRDANDFSDTNDVVDFSTLNDFDALDDFNDFNALDDLNDFADLNDVPDFNDANSLTIRGPYGPPWPYVAEPIEFEVGSARVRIEIEDENAKYPVGWVLLDDPLIEREVEAGFETFCEWMDAEDVEDEMDSFKSHLEQLKDEGIKLKPFKLEFKPKRIRTRVKETASSRRTASGRGARSRRGRSRRPRIKTTTTSVAEQMTTQAMDFTKLFHSSLVDTDILARPIVVSETRKESALKYMGVWGSMKVNINTAPRHVLEAAFSFGGDAEKIADEVIERRRIKPFTDIADLKRSLFPYSNSIKKCEKYIVASSSFFTIRVTAASGTAKASAVIAIRKDGDRLKRIGIISG